MRNENFILQEPVFDQLPLDGTDTGNLLCYHNHWFLNPQLISLYQSITVENDRFGSVKTSFPTMSNL